MSLDSQRVAGLAKIKLETLVRRTFPEVTSDAETFAAGAALAHLDRAFVHLVDDTPSPMAAALAWGDRHGRSELHVIVDEPDPLLSAMADGLVPRPILWQVDRTDLRPMPSVSLPGGIGPPENLGEEAELLEQAGCDVLIEHGVVIGEVLGIEVARLVRGADGAPQVRVGVGLYDQEAHAIMHRDETTERRLQLVIDEVRRHRRRAAAPHPLNRLARERWLRSTLVADPALVGLDSLDPVEPLVPRGGIHEERPVAALGASAGERVLVVCSTGIDLDLVPVAAAHLGRLQPDRVLLVLPERDHHPIVGRMARHLARPAELVAIDEPWGT